MQSTGVKRKLSVILACDFEGYTRLMRADEEATLKTLKAYREIIDAGVNGAKRSRHFAMFMLLSTAVPPRRDAIAEEASDPQAVLVPNISRRGERRLATLYEGLVALSQRYVYLTTPYFCPATVVGDALRSAARRGVDARLLVPRQSDPPFVGWGTRAGFNRLLDAGVRIYEYLPRKLHAKTAVIDGEWSIIGSANLDYLSLRVNHEIVLIARHPGLGVALREQYFQDLSQAAEVLPLVWAERPWRERLVEVIGRAAYRLF